MSELLSSIHPIAVCFIVFAVFTNKFINAFRMYRANEELSSTEAGERLVTIRNYKTLYEYLLAGPDFNNENADEAGEETAENAVDSE